MKVIKLTSIVLGILSLVFVVSCSKDDDNPTNNTQTTVQSNVQSGTWRITKFIDSGIDETNHFQGYNIQHLPLSQ
jgi:hypothetical protein